VLTHESTVIILVEHRQEMLSYTDSRNMFGMAASGSYLETKEVMPLKAALKMQT